MSGTPDAGDGAGVELAEFWGEASPEPPPPGPEGDGAVQRLEEPAWWDGPPPLRQALEGVSRAVRLQAVAALAALAAAPDPLPAPPEEPPPARPAPTTAAPQPRAIALPGFEDAVRGQVQRRAGWRWR